MTALRLPLFHCRTGASIFCCLLCLFWLAGCGSKSKLPEFHKDLVPVSGIVTYKNEPLADAGISFLPTGTDAVRAAFGRTDASGTYSVMTPIRGLSPEQSQGAVPGTYRVVISQLKMPDGSPVPAEMTHADAERDGAKESLPPKYSSYENSKLAADIKQGTPLTDLNFDLK